MISYPAPDFHEISATGLSTYRLRGNLQPDVQSSLHLKGRTLCLQTEGLGSFLSQSMIRFKKKFFLNNKNNWQNHTPVHLVPARLNNTSFSCCCVGHTQNIYEHNLDSLYTISWLKAGLRMIECQIYIVCTGTEYIIFSFSFSFWCRVMDDIPSMSSFG